MNIVNTIGWFAFIWMLCVTIYLLYNSIMVTFRSGIKASTKYLAIIITISISYYGYVIPYIIYPEYGLSGFYHGITSVGMMILNVLVFLVALNQQLLEQKVDLK